MLMGDFNYRFLSWPPLHDDQSATNEALGLFHCLEDCFFTQHLILYSSVVVRESILS